MEAKTINIPRRKYDAAFKQEVLKMVAAGRSVADVCRSLGIGENLVYNWKAQSETGTIAGEKENTVVYNEAEAALHKRIRGLEQERDILKKALGIFSRPI